MRIAVLFGGASEERDVSIASASQVIPALRSLGHEVVAIDTATGRLPAAAEQRLLSAAVAAEPPSDVALKDLRASALSLAAQGFDARDADVVFLALHGGAGEDGRIQAMLDLAGLRYTGSDHISSAAAMDKDLSKRLFRAAGVPTWDAIVEAAVRRLRPIVLTAAAAVLAMIPLSRSVFWGPMAVAIMGGLIVATVLTLLALPAMYAAWFRVKREPADSALSAGIVTP